jgi:predicted nuclease with TOPRIM domain
MKRAAPYKKQVEQLKKELKELQAAYEDLGKTRDSLRDQRNLIEAENNTLRYELNRQRTRVDAMEYALVLAQAHAAPMQRREFDNRGWEVTPSETGMTAQFHKDKLKIAS